MQFNENGKIRKGFCGGVLIVRERTARSGVKTGAWAGSDNKTGVGIPTVLHSHTVSSTSEQM